MTRSGLSSSEQRLEWTGQRRAAGRVVGEALRAHRRQVIGELDGLADFLASAGREFGSSRSGRPFERAKAALHDGCEFTVVRLRSSGRVKRRSTVRHPFRLRTRPVCSSAACIVQRCGLRADEVSRRVLAVRIVAVLDCVVSLRWLDADRRRRWSISLADHRSGVQCSGVQWSSQLWIRM
jgi:hypothetical protein